MYNIQPSTSPSPRACCCPGLHPQTLRTVRQSLVPPPPVSLFLVCPPYVIISLARKPLLRDSLLRQFLLILLLVLQSHLLMVRFFNILLTPSLSASVSRRSRTRAPTTRRGGQGWLPKYPQPQCSPPHRNRAPRRGAWRAAARTQVREERTKERGEEKERKKESAGQREREKDCGWLDLLHK